MDVRKPLAVFHEEWDGCQRCSLSEHRTNTNAEVVHGVGVRRSIMFVGPPPSEDDQRAGEPFSGDAGALFRKVLRRLGILPEEAYLTSAVLCRSAKAAMGDDGQPLLVRRRGKPPTPWYRDESPPDDAMTLCRERLQEELYLVDPIVIVACGSDAASILMGRKVKASTIRGKEVEISINGAGLTPQLTEKRHQWSRDGRNPGPSTRTLLRYLMVPTFDPLFVQKNILDQKAGNPFSTFVQDISRALGIHDRTYREAFGIDVQRVKLTEDT